MNSQNASDNRILAAVMFTDMVGYTALMQENEALARQKRARHREVMEALHKEFSGQIIQYFGDGTLSIFTSSVHALECAIHIQRELQAPIHVPLRIGIHAGEIVVEEDNIIGDAVNLAARIESFSIPGAVLFSETVLAQIQNQPQLQSISMGEFHFKNVNYPISLYALSNEGLVLPDPNQLKGKGKRASEKNHNLPQQLTSFIGREKEIQELCTLLPDERLITITGPGGTGKTRLSLQVGETLSESFQDGVFWVPLASISGKDAVELMMIKSIGLIQTPNKESLDLLIGFLKEKEVLLVLDNFEHVIEAAEVVGTLLASCPDLKIIVTSRIVLNLQAEQEYPLNPMKVPSLQEAQRYERVLDFPSVDLFSQRAKAVKPSFKLNDRNISDVVSICRRLDGLPLGIELAAARAKIFSPKALLVRLDKHLDLLKSENADRPERHYTLRHTISWSYHLLSKEEQILFNRLAVFSGGCYIEAIEAICVQDDWEGVEIFDLISALVSKSLITQKEDFQGEPRFYQLETIRAFAQEKLREQEDVEQIQYAHAEYFVENAEEAEPNLTGSDQVFWLSMLEEDLDNYREVLHWTIERRKYELAFRLGIGIWRLWISRGMLREGELYTHKLLELKVSDEFKHLRAKMISALIATYFHTGSFAKALTFCKENLAYWEGENQEKEIAQNLNHLGFAYFNLGELQLGIQHTDRAMSLYRRFDDIRGQAVSFNNFGWGYFAVGRPKDALINFRESLSLRKRLEDQRGIGFALVNLGRTQVKLGLFQDAFENLTEGLAMLKQNKNMVIYFWGNMQLARLYYEQNELEKCAEILELQREDNPSLALSKGILGWFLILRAVMAIHQGEKEKADGLFEQGVQEFMDSDIAEIITAGWHTRSKWSYLQEDSNSAWRFLTYSLEINLKHDILLGLAENLELAGLLLLEEEQWEKSTLLLSKSGQMREELACPTPPVFIKNVDAGWASLAEKVAPEKLSLWKEKGQQLTTEESRNLFP